MGWTYWIISWVSTTAVVVASIGYLTPLFHSDIRHIHLLLEIMLLLSITLINLRGVTTAGYVEFILMIIKVTALLIIPITALFYFNKNNFVISKEISDLTTSQILGRATLLTLWCFIGLESGTAPAESVINPGKTIPKAILLGTICVAMIYFINSISIMGLINGNELCQSKAPYVDVIKIIFPGKWYLIVSVVAFIVCIGSLNAWVLASGQVALGLAKDRLMPKFFTRENKYNAPFYGVIISSLGTAFLLILTSNNNFARQITSIIDFSVISFLFVYLACIISFLKFILQEKRSYVKLLVAVIAMSFCCWVVFETSITTLLTASLFTFSGLPIYFFWYRKS